MNERKKMMEALESYRDLKRWKKADLARELGVSSQTINNWYNRGIPPESWLKVASHIGKTVEEILGQQKRQQADGDGELSRFEAAWRAMPEIGRIYVLAFMEAQLKLMEERPELFERSPRERRLYEKFRKKMDELKAAENDPKKRR